MDKLIKYKKTTVMLLIIVVFSAVAFYFTQQNNQIELAQEQTQTNLVFEYGFEDWGGDIASTPLYPFSTSRNVIDSGEWSYSQGYRTYCEAHEANSI